MPYVGTAVPTFVAKRCTAFMDIYSTGDIEILIKGGDVMQWRSDKFTRICGLTV